MCLKEPEEGMGATNFNDMPPMRPNMGKHTEYF